MHHRTKFREDRSNRSGDMADFRFFKMAAAARVSVPNFVEIAQNVAEIWRFVMSMNDLSIFQDGGRPPSWIGFTRVGTTHEEYFVVFVAMQNLVVIGAEISTVCNF